MRRALAMLALSLFWLPIEAQAAVKTHGLCQEGMVLQQMSQVKIWGTADKGEKVTVEFRGKSASATADQDGRWVVKIDSGSAGGPHEMRINEIHYKNVLVGEVWVCSGQSNMEWKVASCNAADKDLAKGEPHNPMLRTFNVQRQPLAKPTTETTGSWIEAKPATVEGFSATAYFFGRDLQKALKVPVGLIHTSWGGTRAEAWTSKEELDGNPLFKGEHVNFAKALDTFTKDPTKKTAAGKDANPLNANSPSALYNGMIVPVLNYSIKGAIWYQGESNAGAAYKYRTLFPLMIENWRKDFAQGPFPFYFVQLAPHIPGNNRPKAGKPVDRSPTESTWAELREAQSMTLKLANTGIAVITDFGNEYDIHPTPKQPVGERLSLAARAQTYGEKIVYSGPAYKSMKTEGNKIVLGFNHVGGGLVSRKLVPTLVKSDLAAFRVDPSVTDAELVGFTICGKDRKFHDAKAIIQGGEVIVSSPQVETPEAVRYGWADHPICGLFNREGLPASPFRTDTFPGITQPKQ